MVSRVGSLHCSFTTWVVGAGVFSFHAMTESSTISLLWIVARMSATFQTAVRVVLYDLMKFLYTFMWTSCVSDVISSSNISNAVWITITKVSVLSGCLALGMIFIFAIVVITVWWFNTMWGIAAIFRSKVRLYFMDAHCNRVRECCPDLRTHWYSHQSNK